MDKFEHVVLNGLFKRTEYARRVLPYIKPRYLKRGPGRLLFAKIKHFIETYNAQPTADAIIVEMDRDKQIDDTDYKATVDLIDDVLKTESEADLDWLIDRTEQWVKDRAIEEAILDSIKIIEGDVKGLNREGIPELLAEALSISFDPSVGIELTKDYEARFDRYKVQFAERIESDVTLLNRFTGGGFPRKTLNIFMGQTNSGKAITNSTVIPSPFGPRRFGDLRVGDMVFGSDGRPTRINGVYPQGPKRIFEVTFSDNRSVRCCREHLWEVHRSGLKPKVMTTEEMAHSLKTPTYAKRTFVPLAGPAERDPKAYELVTPYVMGVLLGDGHLRQEHITLSNPEPDIIDRVRRELPDGYELSRHTGSDIDYYLTSGGRPHLVKQKLTALGLGDVRSDTKFIPSVYLEGSIEQRLALLSGLLDTDGEVDNGGGVIFTTASPHLARDVQELVWSLGGKTSLRTKQPYHTYKGVRKAGKLSYRISITFGQDSPVRTELFHCKRKKEAFARAKGKPSHLRVVSVVDTTETEDCTCIAVEADDRLFLVNDYIVTHNTLVMCSLAAAMTAMGRNVLYVSGEVAEDVISQRIEANLLNVPISIFRDMPRTEYVRRMERLEQDVQGRLIIKEYPTASASSLDIRSLIEELKLKAQFVPDVVFVDYINIFRSSRVVSDNSYVLVKNIAEEMRGLAVEKNVALISATQVRRDAMDASALSLRDVPESKALADTVDWLGGLSIPPAMKHEQQILVQVLKTRYGDVTKIPSFAVGVNREMQRIRDLDEQPLIIHDEELFDTRQKTKPKRKLS